MTGFLLLKWIHVMSAIVAVGANVTYGVWGARAKGEPEHLGFALRGLKFLDDRIANPAYGILLVTGLIMAFTTYSITTRFILAGLILFVLMAVLGGAVYSPALVRQIKALDTEGAASRAYQAADARARGVGMFLGLLAVIAVFVMVFKPT